MRGNPGSKADAFRNITRLLGVALVVIACLFVADRFVSTRVWTLVEAGGEGFVVAVVLGAAAYALSAFLLAAAWLVLLRSSGEAGAPVRPSMSIYARTQLAKYIPGNVFHFVGRHAMGRSHGFGHGAMLWAAFLEGGGLIVAACFLALPGALLWLEPGAELSAAALAVLGGLLLFAPYALSYVLPRLARVRGLAARTFSAGSVTARIVPAYLFYVAFFVISGCIAWGLAASLGVLSVSALPLLVASIATAWIAGYVTPGAAAGIGVREAVLIAVLSGTLGEANAALVAVAFRIVTLGGDLLFFALSFPLALNASRSRA